MNIIHSIKQRSDRASGMQQKQLPTTAIHKLLTAVNFSRNKNTSQVVVNRSSYLLLIVCCGSLFSGCVVGGKFTQPQVATDSIYPNQVSADSITNLTWVALYQDTVLARFIKTTLDSNRNLLTAAARVEEAREIAGVVKANLYPAIGLSAGAAYGTAGTDAQKLGQLDGGSLSAFGTLSWEIDIWGKLRHAKRAAQSDFLAEIENRNALQVSLIAEVASNYFILRDLDNRLDIAKRTLISRHENTMIITARFDTGYVSELDKLQAEQQEYVAEGAIPEFERQITQIENALRVLMGMNPGTVIRGKPNVDQVIVPTIPSGIPAELLDRRPDIRSASLQMQAQFDRVGVAKANRLPVISLTGLLGFASPELNTFLTSGGFAAGGGAGLFAPLFNFGKLKHATKAEEFRLQQSAYQYQETILEAFSDVDNSLKNYESYTRQYDIVHRQVEAARKALILSEARYNFGYTDYTEVIIQQDNLFSAELNESFLLQSKLNSTVSLYRSLGGGW
ncbi:MAG: TolC family protein [Chitinophagales bacterium]|nr:TolC family protein [Chitinophagales bacterium]